ncbi:MAG: hypothetical protein QOC82_3264 [Frankiaceae bacterium]|jgi:hypothetical protein|nr:hypothetical protein [Frankiaceae bacterium]
MPIRAHRRAFAWLAAALACLATAIPSLAGPEAPALGSSRILIGVFRLAGADGALWEAAAWATASDVAATADHTVYFDLARCPGFDARCTEVGAWRIPVAANAIQVSSDLSTASLHATIGGFAIAMALHATDPADPVLPADPLLIVRDADTPPTASVGVVQESFAAGTVAFAGRTCQITRGLISETTGVDTEGHAGPSEGTYSDAPVPTGFSPAFAHGRYGKPTCLQPNAVPNAGQRIALPGGSYTGQLTVPAGGTLDPQASLINIEASNDKAVAVLILKKIGQGRPLLNESVVRIPHWDEVFGPMRSGYAPRAPLPAGTYEFALASNSDVVAHLFATKHMRVSLHRDRDWQVNRQMVDISPALKQTTQTLTRAFTKTPKTTGIVVGTYSVWGDVLPPVSTYEAHFCYRPRGQACTYEASWNSTGENIGWGSYDRVETFTVATCVGCMGALPNGPAESFLQLNNTGSKGTLDLVTVAGPLG